MKRMKSRYQSLAAELEARFGNALEPVPSTVGQLAYVVPKDRLLEVATALRDAPEMARPQSTPGAKTSTFSGPSGSTWGPTDSSARMPG